MWCWGLLVFRRFVAICFFLTACDTSFAPQTSSYHAAVKPHLPNYEARPLPDDCKWAPKSISVFNQPTQTVSFLYMECIDKYGTVTTFSIDEGGTEITSRIEWSYPDTDRKDTEVREGFAIGISKLGPYTEEDFMKWRFDRHRRFTMSTDTCPPKEISLNLWQPNTFRQFNSQCSEKSRSIYVFDNGIVFELPRGHPVIDLSSITYTNKG